MEEDADSEPLVSPVPVISHDEVPTVLAMIITLIELCKVSWLHAFIPKYCELVYQ